MARIAATHAMQHPESTKKVLLLRRTTNPSDRLGTFAVIGIIPKTTYSTEYQKHTEWIQEKPRRVIENNSGEPDAVIIGNSKERQFVPGYEDIVRELDIDRSKVPEKLERGHATDADEVADLVNSIALTNRSQPAVTRVRVERAERVAKRSSSVLNNSILKRFLR